MLTGLVSVFWYLCVTQPCNMHVLFCLMFIHFRLLLCLSSLSVTFSRKATTVDTRTAQAPRVAHDKVSFVLCVGQCKVVMILGPHQQCTDFK